jgi:hypothetical protein
MEQVDGGKKSASLAPEVGYCYYYHSLCSATLCDRVVTHKPEAKNVICQILMAI